MLRCCADPQCVGYTINRDYCSMGTDLSSCVHTPGSGNRGGAKDPAHIPPRPQPPANGPQSVSYDDSNWTAVQLPHDAIVATAAWDPRNEESHGFFAKEHFMVSEGICTAGGGAREDCGSGV